MTWWWQHRDVGADPTPSKNALRDLNEVRRELKKQAEAVRLVLLEERRDDGRRAAQQ